MPRLALVTAVAATGHDEDMLPLLQACRAAGISTRVAAWDDASIGWNTFDAALLRSPWDYTERLPEFLLWCERVAAVTPLFNPLPVLRWNTDKHYLKDLEAAGIAAVPTRFVEPDVEPLDALQSFLAAFPSGEFVVKPAISAGARDTQRYSRSQQFAAGNHIARLLGQDRSVMLQPYLGAVDASGETALIFLDGQFSHAIRKGAQLQPDAPATQTPHATGDISVREPRQPELALAHQVLEATARHLQLQQALTYARIDLISDDDGNPRLLELELTEPSLFFAQAPGSAERLASVLAGRMAAAAAPVRTASA